jgi:hypothetical protein
MNKVIFESLPIEMTQESNPSRCFEYLHRFFDQRVLPVNHIFCSMALGLERQTGCVISLIGLGWLASLL